MPLPRSTGSGPRSVPQGRTRPFGARGGGPRLDVSEWITLLDIHLRHNGAVLGPEHPDLVAASAMLSARAARRGNARDGAVLRSPSGLSRRTAAFRSLRDGRPGRLPAIAVEVWRRFADDPITCRELALCAQGPEFGEPTATTGPSRGPKPWAGTFTVDRRSNQVFVYLMTLVGEGGPVFRDGHCFLKLGSGLID